MNCIRAYASLLLVHALACSPIEMQNLPAAEEDGGSSDRSSMDPTPVSDGDEESAGRGGTGGDDGSSMGGTSGRGSSNSAGNDAGSGGAAGNGGMGGDAMGPRAGASGEAGSSGSGDPMCEADQKACGSECVPESGCCDDAECPMGATCEGGMCVCPSGTHLCEDSCASDTAPESCGTSCDPCEVPTGGTAACTDGMCVPMCPTGQKICAGACIPQDRACDGQCPEGTHDCMGLCSQDTSPMTCGTMCAACKKPSNGTATCDGMECGFNCNNGFKKCEDSCQPECCQKSDCEQNEACQEGRCVCTPRPNVMCGSDGCTDKGPCPSGQRCDNGQCVCVPRPNVMCGSDGCTDKGPCPSGQRCDNGQCVCVPRPNVECGSNGCEDVGKCASNERCNNGRCECVPRPDVECGNNGCENVGTCSNGEQCVNGQCVCTPNCTPCGRDLNDCPGSTCTNQCVGNRMCNEATQTCVDRARCGDGMVSGDEECDPEATNDYHCHPVSCRVQAAGAETAFDACTTTNPGTCTGQTSCSNAFDVSLCLPTSCTSIPSPFRQINVGEGSAVPYCFLDCALATCPNNTSCRTVDFFGVPTPTCLP